MNFEENEYCLFEIGTGQLGLEPDLVCEAMISAASEQLHQCQLDVIFVIYPITGIKEEDECYQVLFWFFFVDFFNEYFLFE